MSETTYRLLKWIAAIGVVAWIGFEIYRHFAGLGPGDVAYIDGNSLFNDGQYARAVKYYQSALETKPDHLPALRALANSYIQLKRYDEALTVIHRAMQLDPNFAGHYATRGIIYDRMGRHKKAMADYRKALAMDKELARGMHWLDRLLYNVQERPPTIADRLKYLEAQMALPPHKRLLRVPEIDDKQRPYEQ